MAGATFTRTKTDTGFEHIDQARQRLEGTVVLFKEEGHYVSSLESRKEGFCINVAKLPCNIRGSFTNKREYLSDPSFNRFKPFELGFVNLFEEDITGGNTNCMFTYRRPLRSGARQGLIREALEGRYVQNSRGNRLEGFDMINLLCAQSFADMIANKYPSYEEALSNLIPQSSIAFDRNYCVVKDDNKLVWLYRQLERIGLIQEKTKEILLFSAKRYLREELQEKEKMPNIQLEI